MGPLEACPVIYSGHFGNTFTLELSSMAWLKFPEILESFGELLDILECHALPHSVYSQVMGPKDLYLTKIPRGS